MVEQKMDMSGWLRKQPEPLDIYRSITPHGLGSIPQQWPMRGSAPGATPQSAFSAGTFREPGTL